MTISSSNSSIQIAGNGSNRIFTFNFVADSASDLVLSSVVSGGTPTVISSNNYTVSLNAPATNQLWGIGGTVTYPSSGSALPLGSSLLIQRLLPLTQETTVQNQGNYYAQTTEIALDTIEMQIQQVSSRTGQLRGIWASGIAYNYGDVVIDGGNGNSTFNYYMCVNANTSGTWSTDLFNGDWELTQPYPSITGITLTGDVTGSGVASFPTTVAAIDGMSIVGTSSSISLAGAVYAGVIAPTSGTPVGTQPQFIKTGSNSLAVTYGNGIVVDFFGSSTAGDYFQMESAVSGGTLNLFAASSVGDPNIPMNISTQGTGNLSLFTNSTQRLQITGTGNVVVGAAALTNTATAGFLVIPSCSSVPTGTPSAPYTGAIPLIFNTTAQKLYAYTSGSWVQI